MRLHGDGVTDNVVVPCFKSVKGKIYMCKNCKPSTSRKKYTTRIREEAKWWAKVWKRGSLQANS